jgi:hypothetical protein
MSRKARRKKGDSSKSLEGFTFDPSELDLKMSRNLITVMDGYRINRTYDTTFVDKAINEGKVARSFVTQWGTIRSVLHKLAAIGPKVPNVEKWMNQRQTMSFISMALLTITVPLLLLTWVFQIVWIAPYATPLAVVALALVMISWLTSAWFNRKIAWAIHDFLEANPETVAKERSVLKEWVQKLVHHTARIMRKGALDSAKHLVKFFNHDYSGITVLKEPGGFRKHYVVQIQTGRKKERSK